MKHINTEYFYTKKACVYEIEEQDKNKTIDELIDELWIPFGYTDAYIKDNKLYITIYTD